MSFQPPQTICQKVLDCHRAVVDANPAPDRVTQRAELEADHDALASLARQSLADQKFVVAAAAGVDQSDAGIESGEDGGDAFRAVGRTVKVRHAHRAKPKGGDGRTVFSKGARHWDGANRHIMLAAARVLSDPKS
jgi:hypothetical protein